MAVQIKVSFTANVINREAIIDAARKIPEEQRLWSDEELPNAPTSELIKEILFHLDVISGGKPISFADIGFEV